MIFLPLLILFCALGIYCLFILTLQNTFRVISPQYRMMSPESMWRLLIPLYNYWFLFKVADNLSDSISMHLTNHDTPVDNGKPTQMAGKLFAISSLAYFLIGALSISETVNGLAAVASLVFFIIYWSQVSSYKKKVEQAPTFLLDAERTGVE